MNVIGRLEYELAYCDSAVHRFNHYTTRIPPIHLSYIKNSDDYLRIFNVIDYCSFAQENQWIPHQVYRCNKNISVMCRFCWDTLICRHKTMKILVFSLSISLNRLLSLSPYIYIYIYIRWRCIENSLIYEPNVINFIWVFTIYSRSSPN